MAATSWHWVLPANKYQKAAALIKDTGTLVLLWNTTMMPPLAIFESSSEVFRPYLPEFAEYKDRDRGSRNEMRKGLKFCRQNSLLSSHQT